MTEAAQTIGAVDNNSRPASPLDEFVARAIDQELEWFFSYAEAAMRRQSVGMLPPYAATAAGAQGDDAVRAQALDLAFTVKQCLGALPGRHAEVLRAAYTPRTWPANVERAFPCLSAVVVRIALAADPWPTRSGKIGLEQATAKRLATGLLAQKVAVAHLRKRARRILGRAVVAYANRRALASSLTGGAA